MLNLNELTTVDYDHVCCGLKCLDHPIAEFDVMVLFVIVNPPPCHLSFH